MGMKYEWTIITWFEWVWAEKQLNPTLLKSSLFVIIHQQTRLVSKDQIENQKGVRRINDIPKIRSVKKDKLFYLQNKRLQPQNWEKKRELQKDTGKGKGHVWECGREKGSKDCLFFFLFFFLFGYQPQPKPVCLTIKSFFYKYLERK